jgi:hypothetical protein
MDEIEVTFHCTAINTLKIAQMQLNAPDIGNSTGN